MIKNTIALTFYLIFIVTCINREVKANELFFKCNADGSMTESLSTGDLERLALKKDENLLEKLCGTDKECWRQFNQAYLLASTIHNVSEELVDQGIKDFLANSQQAKDEIIKEFDQEIYQSKKNELDLLASIQACRNESLNLKDHFLDEDNVVVYYPNNTQYSYVSGIRKDKPYGFKQFSKVQLQQIIQNAVLMGVDPRVVLSISFMETTNRPVDLQTYMHDSAILAVLDCSDGKQTAENDKLSKNLKRLVEVTNNKKLEEGTSWLCNGQKQYNNKLYDLSPLTIHSSPDSARLCCLKLPWKSPENITPIYPQFGMPPIDNMPLSDDQVVKAGITMGFLKKLQNEPAGKSPEMKLQKFLGFSHNTGSGMTSMLAPFRLGVDSYNTPTYGLQAMDYMVNSIMTNPVINELIDEAEKKVGSKIPSFLCQNRKPGVYALDRNEYFKKHQAAPRLERIHAKFKKGVPWSQLSKGEKNVLISEFSNHMSAVSMRLRKEEYLNIFPSMDGSGMISSLNQKGTDKAQLADLEKAYKVYFTKPGYYSDRKTVGQAAAQDTDYTWKSFSNTEIKDLGNSIKNQKTMGYPGGMGGFSGGVLVPAGKFGGSNGF